MLNAKYIVIFKSVRDKNQFLYLAQQVYPEDSQCLYAQYLDATRKPHCYLLLDPAQDTDDLVRFRTDIFNPHYTTVYAPVDHETDKVELTCTAGP